MNLDWRRSLDQMIRYAARFDAEENLAVFLAEAFQQDPERIRVAIEEAKGAERGTVG